MTCSFSFVYGKAGLDLSCALDTPVTGVFGPSGAGKTSLLHLIAGIRRPDSGKLDLDGETLFDHQTGVNIPTRNRDIAVVFQEARLFPHLSVEGNLRFGLDLSPAEKQRFRFDEIVALLELAPLLSRRPASLSGGEKQRVAIGRAVLSSPRLLLLDEPLASLDRGRKTRILHFLRKVRDQLSLPMIYVSHDLSEILQLTDHLLVLSEGRMVGYGSFLELAQQAAVLDLIHDLGLINVIPAKIATNQPDQGIATLHAENAFRFIGPDTTAASVYATLRPEDIALVTKPVPEISIQNQIPGRIVNLVRSHHKALCFVNVGVTLLVEVTPHAAEDLRLRIDQEIYCLFKAQAVKYLT